MYVKDLVTGDLTLVSTSDSGVKGNSDSIRPSLSADGTRVAFYSHATNLDPADTDAVTDVYVKDLVTGDLTLVSTSDSGVKGNSGSSTPVVSADGTKVAFDSFATNLDPADTDSSLRCVCQGSGYRGSHLGVDVRLRGERKRLQQLFASLSADGTKVAFLSFATNLDPADTDSLIDVYVKDLVTGDLTLASTSDSGVKGNGTASARQLSADGTKVAFDSFATNLDPADTDTFAMCMSRIWLPGISPWCRPPTRG